MDLGPMQASSWQRQSKGLARNTSIRHPAQPSSTPVRVHMLEGGRSPATPLCRCRGLPGHGPEVAALVMEGPCPQMVTSWRWRRVAAIQAAQAHLGAVFPSVTDQRSPAGGASSKPSAEWLRTAAGAMRPHQRAHRVREWRPSPRSGGPAHPLRHVKSADPAMTIAPGAPAGESRGTPWPLAPFRRPGSVLKCRLGDWPLARVSRSPRRPAPG